MSIEKYDALLITKYKRMKTTKHLTNIVSGEIKYAKRFNLLRKSKPRNMSNMGISIVAHLEFVSIPLKKFSVFVCGLRSLLESLLYVPYLPYLPTILPGRPTHAASLSGFLFILLIHFIVVPVVEKWDFYSNYAFCV